MPERLRGESGLGAI